MNQGRANPSSTNAAGSPLPGEPAFLAVGRLRHAHGVRGEILMEVLTDFPERIKPGITLYLDSGTQELELTKIRHHQAGLLLTLQGYTTPEEVGLLRNQLVYVKTADRPPLPEGEYYQHQLINLTVVNDDGTVIGVATEILETGASDVLVVKPDAGPDVLIPMVDDFILGIDLEQHQIRVHLIPGMLGEET